MMTVIGVVLNFLGIFVVFMTDPTYMEDEPEHYLLYCISILATILIMIGSANTV